MYLLMGMEEGGRCWDGSDNESHILETTWIIMVFYVHNKIQNIEKGDNFLLSNRREI